jgi:hypothetical protein
MDTVGNIQRDENIIASIKGKFRRSMTAADWFHEARVHHKELEIELKNLLHILEVINDSNKKYFDKDIPILVDNINVQLKILKRYYSDFELEELGENPFKNVVKNYLDYNDAKMEKIKKLISTVKFSYN